MKKLCVLKTIILLFFFLIVACKKDNYKVGGDLHNPQIDMTTYDYLRSNRFGLFDTLLLLIDKAGIKEKINQKGTFFAPTDYSINRYIEARTIAVQKADPFKEWTIYSIIKYELPRFIDSMDIYFIKDKLLPNAVLTAKGTIFTNDKNSQIVVSYEETTNTNLGYNQNSSVKPKIVYFTYLYIPLVDDFDITSVKWPVGVRTLVQSSNGQTTTGTLHVLNNSHTLFFFR